MRVAHNLYNYASFKARHIQDREALLLITPEQWALIKTFEGKTEIYRHGTNSQVSFLSVFV